MPGQVGSNEAQIAGITNSAPANAIPKSDGTNLISSRITDDGTNMNAEVADGTFQAGDFNYEHNGSYLSLNDTDAVRQVSLVVNDNDVEANAVLQLNGNPAGAVDLYASSGTDRARLHLTPETAALFLGFTVLNILNALNLDTAGGILRAGDLLAAGNGMEIEVDDPNQTIKLGDVNGSGNNTLITVDDDTQLIRAAAGAGASLLQLEAGDTILKDAAGLVQVGSPGVGNATLITANDPTKTITLATALADGIVKLLASKVIQSVPAAAVPFASLESGQISFYLDEGGNKLMVAVKYSGGTTKTGEVALT